MKAVDAYVRVLLSACELKSGLTYFRGQLLDGVGVEADSARGKYPGQVWLWRYRQGRRVSAHVEPLFGDESVLIVNARSTSYSEIDSYTVEGERYSGLVAIFGQRYSTKQAHLMTLLEVFDALPTGTSMSWHKDGSINEVAKTELEKTDAGLLSITRYERHRDQAMDHTLERSRLSLMLGHDVPGTRPTRLATIDEDATYPPFRTLSHDDPSSFSTSCTIEFDENQKIQSVDFSTLDYFTFLERHPISPGPCRWLPTSLFDLAEIGVGKRLRLRLNSVSLRAVITAFGPDGLAPVKDLELAAFELEVDDIAAMFALPDLKRLSVRASRDSGLQRGIREMLIDLKARRPNIQITLNQRPILPNGVIFTDQLVDQHDNTLGQPTSIYRPQ